MEIHNDAVDAGEKVLVVDDLLATGGTVEASLKLLEQLGADVIGCSFIIDLPSLGGRKLLEKMGISINTICSFSDS